MEFDKEFRLPFKQTSDYSVANADNQVLIIKDYSKWGGTGQAGQHGTAPWGLLGQTSTDGPIGNNCPPLADVYSQLVNYEYVKIHAVEEEFKIIDFFLSGNSVGLARNSAHWSRDPAAQLLWKTATNASEESYYSNTEDLDDYMRVLPGTVRGVRYFRRWPTEMRMLRGIAGRRLLTWAGRLQSPGIDVGDQRCANIDSPGGYTGSGTTLRAFNIGNNGADHNGAGTATNHGANLFYWSKGQIYQPVPGQCDALNIISKYWNSTTNPPANKFLPFNETVNDMSFPRCVYITPFTETTGSLGGITRCWRLQNITTLIVKARGYLPAKAGAGLALEMAAPTLYPEPPNEPVEKKIKLEE